MTDDDLTRLRDEVAAVLRGEGLTDRPDLYDSSIHSWRCEYPDRYGPCGCFADLIDALLPLLTRKIAEAWNAGYCTNRDPSAVKLAHLHNPYMQAPEGEEQ